MHLPFVRVTNAAFGRSCQNFPVYYDVLPFINIVQFKEMLSLSLSLSCVIWGHHWIESIVDDVQFNLPSKPSLIEPSTMSNIASAPTREHLLALG